MMDLQNPPPRPPKQNERDILKIKQAVREKDGHKCVRCEMTADEHRELYGRNLDVHRNVPGSWYTVEGCVTLCRPCHSGEPKRAPGERFKTEPWAAHSMRMDPELRDLMPEFIVKFRQANDIKPSITDVVEMGLRLLYRKWGLLPPSEQETPPAKKPSH